MNPDDPAFVSRTKSESATFGLWPTRMLKMVRNVINRYHILALPGYDAGHVFLKLIVMLWPDQALPPLHSENNLDVDLGVRIRHSMSLLRS
jgi:hypothetical protein